MIVPQTLWEQRYEFSFPPFTFQYFIFYILYPIFTEIWVWLSPFKPGSQISILHISYFNTSYFIIHNWYPIFQRYEFSFPPFKLWSHISIPNSAFVLSICHNNLNHFSSNCISQTRSTGFLQSVWQYFWLPDFDISLKLLENRDMSW